jgi:hypothetical protein
MPTRSDDPRALQEFAASLGARDPKTVATYLTTVRDFVTWLTSQPGGTSFHLGLVTETAVRGTWIFWLPRTAHHERGAKPSRRCAVFASGQWMRAISVATQPVRWNVPR